MGSNFSEQIFNIVGLYGMGCWWHLLDCSLILNIPHSEITVSVPCLASHAHRTHCYWRWFKCPHTLRTHNSDTRSSPALYMNIWHYLWQNKYLTFFHLFRFTCCVCWEIPVLFTSGAVIKQWSAHVNVDKIHSITTDDQYFTIDLIRKLRSAFTDNVGRFRGRLVGS